MQMPAAHKASYPLFLTWRRSASCWGVRIFSLYARRPRPPPPRAPRSLSTVHPFIGTPECLHCETGGVADWHDPYVGFMNFICSDKTTHIYSRRARRQFGWIFINGKRDISFSVFYEIALRHVDQNVGIWGKREKSWIFTVRLVNGYTWWTVVYSYKKPMWPLSAKLNFSTPLVNILLLKSLVNILLLNILQLRMKLLRYNFISW